MTHIILGMARTGHLPSRWLLGKHGAETLLGLGMGMWVLLPTSTGRTVAFYVATGAAIAGSYIVLAERRKVRSPPPMDH